MVEVSNIGSKTVVVKVTVDADKYAAEYGERRPVADIVGEMHGHVHAALNPAPMDWYTHTVEEPTDPMQAMGEATRLELLKEYDEWQAARSRSVAQEDRDGYAEYADSDDDARDMLLRVMAALRRTDECSHGDDDVADDGTVTCAWCGKSWPVVLSPEIAAVAEVATVGRATEYARSIGATVTDVPLKDV